MLTPVWLEVEGGGAAKKAKKAALKHVLSVAEGPEDPALVHRARRALVYAGEEAAAEAAVARRWRIVAR